MPSGNRESKRRQTTEPYQEKTPLTINLKGKNEKGGITRGED